MMWPEAFQYPLISSHKPAPATPSQASTTHLSQHTASSIPPPAAAAAAAAAEMSKVDRATAAAGAAGAAAAAAAAAGAPAEGAQKPQCAQQRPQSAAVRSGHKRMTDECEAPGTPPQQVCGYLRVCVCVYGVCAGIRV